MTHPAASAEGVSKRFGATMALDGVDFDVAFGEIHAIVGENGAGKSTLIRILGGVHRPDRGNISVDGRLCHFASPHDAIAAGIVTIPQELRLVPALSVAENIALGDLPVRRLGPFAMVDRRRMRDEARGAFAVDDLVSAMTGRLAEDVIAVPAGTSEVLLAAAPDGARAVELRAGEVIGLAGLLGSGTDWMLRRLFGVVEPTMVEIRKQTR